MNSEWLMTENDCQDLETRLLSAHSRLSEIVLRISPAMWTTLSPGTLWSASNIVEHVLLSEKVLMDQVRRHMDDPPNPDAGFLLAGQAEKLFRILPSGGKAAAGASVSTFVGLNHAHVSDGFSSSSLEYAKLIQEMRFRPVKAILWRNRFFGDLSAYLWMLYIPLHSERHVAQLRSSGRGAKSTT